jgi:hypothetical protein
MKDWLIRIEFNLRTSFNNSTPTVWKNGSVGSRYGKLKYTFIEDSIKY